MCVSLQPVFGATSASRQRGEPGLGILSNLLPGVRAGPEGSARQGLFHWLFMEVRKDRAPCPGRTLAWWFSRACFLGKRHCGDAWLGRPAQLLQAHISSPAFLAPGLQE